MAASSSHIISPNSDYALCDHKKVIRQVGASLMQMGVKPDCFSEATYLRHGFLTNDFASHLRVFHEISDEVKLERILRIGVKNRIFDTIRGMRPGMFYNFLKFLRTKDGKQALEAQTMLDELHKKMGPGFTDQQVALLELADLQMKDYVSEKNKVCMKYDQIINNLTMKLDKLRQHRDEELSKLKLQTTPTVSFTEDVVPPFTNSPLWCMQAPGPLP